MRAVRFRAFRGRDDARLDPRVAFPFAPLGDQIFLQRGKARHQRAAVAVGAQPHIHAEHITVGSSFVDDVDQAAAEPGKELMIAQLCKAVSFTVFRIDENQIDIR